MADHLLRRPSSTALLDRLIETPNLVQTVRALPLQAFSALVRQIGVEDAGEIVALASTEQIVAAFDEDLFVNTKPGEREVFDSNRFAIWLEVLLEAGDEVAAKRFAELSEDFVIHAISSLVLVLDNDALNARMSEGDSSAIYADKALESALSEEIDGYLLISRKHDGWDAALSLILALDQDYRPLLVRILDRCAAMSSEYVEDLDALTQVLSSEASLAEDVEAARDERRGKLGYVEPRAAQSFLTIARKPLGKALGAEPRDPITRAYFRELERKATETLSSNRALSRPFALPGATANTDCPSPVSTTGDELATPAGPSPAFTDAMGMLKEQQCERFNERMEELAYLANVLAAGAKIGNQRLRPSEAAEAAIATVALGAELEALSRRPRKPEGAYRATARELLEVLSAYGADLLFRKASSRLSARGRTISSTGFIIARDEIASVIERLSAKRTASREDSTRKKPTGRNRGN